MSKRILVVDDEQTSALILCNLAKSFGNAQHASGGEAAFDAFLEAHEKGSPFDLIFLDIMMPEVDGQETLEAIRLYEEQEKFTPPVHVVMVTGLNDSASVYLAHLHGCNDYLTKPVKPNSLGAVISRLGYEKLQEVRDLD